MKSFVPKDGDDSPSGKRSGRSRWRNAERDFHSEKRKNVTHSSTTDPNARLFRKGAGKEAKLCHMGHLMMENRNELIVDARLTEANGTAERTTALDMIEDSAKPGSTAGADKNYDTADFVAGCRERGCTPHVSQNDTNRRSAIDARTTRHPGYRISMTKRKRIEEPFGWIKTVGGLRKTRHRDRGLVEWFFVLTAADLQSRSHSEDAGGNGTNLSGAPNMRQKNSENCVCGAVYRASIGLSSPHTSGKSPFSTHFSAACSHVCRQDSERA